MGIDNSLYYLLLGTNIQQFGSLQQRYLQLGQTCFFCRYVVVGDELRS